MTVSTAAKEPILGKVRTGCPGIKTVLPLAQAPCSGSPVQGCGYRVQIDPRERIAEVEALLEAERNFSVIVSVVRQAAIDLTGSGEVFIGLVSESDGKMTCAFQDDRGRGFYNHVLEERMNGLLAMATEGCLVDEGAFNNNVKTGHAGCSISRVAISPVSIRETVAGWLVVLDGPCYGPIQMKILGALSGLVARSLSKRG